jgi:hypothetical protein
MTMGPTYREGQSSPDISPAMHLLDVNELQSFISLHQLLKARPGQSSEQRKYSSASASLAAHCNSPIFSRVLTQNPMNVVHAGMF